MIHDIFKHLLGDLEETTIDFSCKNKDYVLTCYTDERGNLRSISVEPKPDMKKVLQNDLKKAIEEEDYLKAAKIKQQINEMDK